MLRSQMIKTCAQIYTGGQKKVPSFLLAAMLSFFIVASTAPKYLDRASRLRMRSRRSNHLQSYLFLFFIYISVPLTFRSKILFGKIHTITPSTCRVRTLLQHLHGILLRYCLFFYHHAAISYGQAICRCNFSTFLPEG
ncbi:hypothetical protein CCUS01_03434 [Colletotrichum cuscutae]|uniref:Uncharacterized protein n=1 Tax=Colletotrichum cuscutae TaxID=1209917 RepID=A0AAJ0DKU5_9PEZI|nr:hypothetical protein CCUS01_03434 [Colletotrichum cuscutae]